VVKVSRILKDYRDSGALNALINIQAAIDDFTFLAKGEDLVTLLKVQGVDAECLEPLEISQIVRRFGSAVRTFNGQFRIYQYLVKRDYGQIPHEEYDEPVIREAISSRTAFLENKGLYKLELYFAIVHEGLQRDSNLRSRLAAFVANPAESLRAALSTEKTIGVLDGDLDRRRQELANKVNSFSVQLREFVKIDVLNKKQAFRFLCRLLNYAPYKAESANLAFDQFVDFQMARSSLECHRDHLRLDNYFVQALTLKEPPAQTWPNLLKGLQEIPAQFVIATEWKRMDNHAMRKLIQSKRRHFYNSKASFMNYFGQSGGAPKDVLIDDSAAALVNSLGSCLEDMEVNGSFFGEFSLTVILYDEDLTRLKRSVAECFKAFSSIDAQLTEERYNLLNAFLAVLPANHAFNLRKMFLSSANYGDLSFLFVPNTGDLRNAHLKTEYLTVLETNDRTPYFFNFHDDEIAHTFMLGMTGSGKSFTASHLLTHAQKYNPLTYIFDLGGSYRDLTARFNGTYVRVGADERSFTINPFSLPPTAEHHRFQSLLVRVLAASSGYELTGADERDVFEQVQNLYSVEPGQRRLLTLANILGRNVRQALGKWVQGGQYGALFDNVEDNLTFARFQTFDFEGMDKVPQVLEPLLFYILHRAQAAIYDADLAATFKLFLIDEAWRFLRNPAIRLYVQEALKTWRKKNAAMILATQSGDDLFRSEILPVIVESCATQIFLANPGMDQAAYREAFHLSETVAEKIAGLIPKRQFLIKRPDLTKILNLNVERSHS
jgi:type IV secretion/conjugal transfer VirB4 family ATPase